jgi:hypothetical protein
MKKDIPNKSIQPSENKMVKVRIKPGRAVEGLGGPETEHLVDEREAKRLERIGYVEIVKEAEDAIN